MLANIHQDLLRNPIQKGAYFGIGIRRKAVFEHEGQTLPTLYVLEVASQQVRQSLIRKLRRAQLEQQAAQPL